MRIARPRNRAQSMHHRNHKFGKGAIGKGPIGKGVFAQIVQIDLCETVAIRSSLTSGGFRLGQKAEAAFRPRGSEGKKKDNDHDPDPEQNK